MPKYKITDKVPLSFVRVKANGELDTGLSVTVKVINQKTGATLLTPTALSEVAAGVYNYEWTHGIIEQMNCIALYAVGGRSYPEFFELDDQVERIDNADGRAI